jgi:hypothetical protein
LLTHAIVTRSARLSRAFASCLFVAALAFASSAALAQSKNLAPGFAQLSKDAKVVILPVDVELFSLSAGGVPEPKADWTEAAVGHMKATLMNKTTKLGLNTSAMDDRAADDFAELVGLHAAVARSIALHHSGAGMWALPTKAGKLEWSFGEAMKPLAERTGARYGLFIWVRDSYASAERKAAMVAVALLSMGNVVLGGGVQTGYASLVDLNTGRVVWFNQLISSVGDLREATPAAATVDTLLAGFPAVQ